MSFIAVHPVADTQFRRAIPDGDEGRTEKDTDHGNTDTTRTHIPHRAGRIVISALTSVERDRISKTGFPSETIATINCGALHFNAQFESSIFATTALVASAGVAAAQDITLGGSAGAGIFHESTTSTTDIYNSLELEVTFAGATDNGLTFGATMDVTVGTDLDIGEVGSVCFDADAPCATNLNADEDGTFGLGSIFISGEFGTLTFDKDGIDNVYDDDFSHDFSYAYDAAGFGVTLTYNLNATAAAGDTWSLELSYDGTEAGTVPVTAFLETDDSSEMHLSVGYSITTEFAVGLEYETDGKVTTLSADYETDMFSVGFAVDNNSEWDLDLGYSAQGFSIDVSTDEASAWELTGAYDLGGGLEIVAGTASTSNWYLGAAMSF